MSVQLVLADFAIQCIAVDSKDRSGLGLISTGLTERRLNESFFKFA